MRLHLMAHGDMFTHFKQQCFVLANANSYIPDLAATTRQITGSANPFAAGKVLVRTTT